ncbi:Uncharacterized protein APZ42_003351, partial [Daphnia magna]
KVDCTLSKGFCFRIQFPRRMKYCRDESQVVRLRLGCRRESELLEEENVVVWIYTTLCSLHTRVWQGCYF